MSIASNVQAFAAPLTNARKRTISLCLARRFSGFAGGTFPTAGLAYFLFSRCRATVEFLEKGLGARDLDAPHP